MNVYTARTRKFCNECNEAKDRKGHYFKKCYLKNSLKAQFRPTHEIRKLKSELGDKGLEELYIETNKELDKEYLDESKN